MELFLDGGLFEIAGLLVFASVINYIFSRKYLLIIFSAAVMIAPVLLFFIKETELFNWLMAFIIFNSTLFVLLLWKQRSAASGKPLFDTDYLKRKFIHVKKKLRFARTK